MSNARIRQVARQALARLGVKRFAKADGSPEPIAKPDKAPVFYSHAERVIHEKVPNSAHPDQVRKTLLNNGVKPEEMKWSGLEDHLATATGPVKKSDLLERVRDGNVKVGEVLKKPEPQDMSGPAPGWGSVGGGETKYDEYQLPGGTNYHEMLLTLPQQYNDFHIVPPNRLGDTTWTIREEDGGKIISSHNSREEAKKEFDRRYEQLPKQFNSSHWSEPNVLAHIRFNDREGTNGEKLLHLEEVQSDWGQGIREQGTIEDIRNQHGVEPNGGTYGGYRVFDKRAADAGRLSTEAWAATEEEAKEKMEKIVSAKAKEHGSLPDMPFKRSWHELALRRMIRHAAEHGYDGISWTPGEQQGRRFSLRNKVDSVHYSPEEQRLWAVSDGKNVIDKTNISEDELHKYVGKDVAGKLLSAEADDGTHDRRTVSGDGLEVGGEGMKGFYDKIIPEYLAKYGKKHGAQVGETSIKLAPDEAKDEKSLEHILRVFGRNSDQYQRALAGSLQDKKKTLQVPFFPITPSMRESVVREGQALFTKQSVKDRFSLSSQQQSFASSLRRLGTKQQTKLREIAAKILHQSGLTPHKLSDAFHDTPNDSRPGVAQAIFRPVSQEHTRRAAAQYGLVAGQNSLLVFHGHPEGPDSLYAVDLPGGDESRKMLDNAGFDKRTLIPTKTGFRAIIHDQGRVNRKMMEDFATGAGLSVIESTGYGEMVGDKKPETNNAKAS